MQQMLLLWFSDHQITCSKIARSLVMLSTSALKALCSQLTFPSIFLCVLRALCGELFSDHGDYAR